MAPNSGAASMVCAPARMGVSRFGKRSNSSSSELSESSSFNDRDDATSKFASGVRVPDGKPFSKRGVDSSSPEDGDDEDEADDADEDEASDDEPDEMAPSGPLRKRGHQTGLSVSFFNTNLGKRGRSPGSDDDLERPVSKMSRTSADAGADVEGSEDEGDDDDDDDDVYNAVDDISESEEEADVEQLEEKMIIESEEEDTPRRVRRTSQSSTDSFFGMNEADEGEAFQAGTQYFFNELFPDAPHTLLRGEDEAAADEEDGEDGGAPAARRVRFAEEVQLHSNSSTSTESDEDEEIVYPDLFLHNDSLDPTFQKLLEQKDMDERSSDGESYWDFENEHGAVEELDEEEEGSDSESGSSGYESDEGETTDEEIMPPRTVSKPNISLRQNSRPANRGKAVAAPPAARRSALATPIRRGPLMGSFLVDEDKPIALVDGHGKHMLIFAPPRQRRQAAQNNALTSSPAAAGLSAHSAPSEAGSDIAFSQTDPMLSSPANVMMSGLANTRVRSGSALSSEITGPPEAFFPFTSISSSGMIETDDIDDETFEDLSDEADLRIEDYIVWDDEASSSGVQDGEQATDLTDSNNTTTEEGRAAEQTPQPARTRFPGFKNNRAGNTQSGGNSESLLDHFDRGVASSFRRNNDRHKNWMRSPGSAGLKGSRLHAANFSISPLRRRRGGSISTGNARSPLRPQTNERPDVVVPTPLHHQFGGPLKKRIHNSNRIRRGRKNTI